MAQKFNRNYKLYVDTINASFVDVGAIGLTAGTKSLLIEPPFTVEFSVVKNNLASVNNAEITVYNLSEANRTLIHKDIWKTDIYRPIEFWAGYSNSEVDATIAATMTSTQIKTTADSRKLFPVIFKGNVTRAFSYRSGVNFLTKMVCQDAGFAAVNSYFKSNYVAGDSVGKIIEDLINSMGILPDGSRSISIGHISDTYYDKKIKKRISISGDPKDILMDYSNRHFFIDNEKAYVLNDNEFFKGSVPSISNINGILGVPLKETTLVHVDLIFEPGIVIGQSIFLDTTNVQYYNGPYKVTGLSHKGMISDSVCGEVITSLILTAIDENGVEVAIR